MAEVQVRAITKYFGEVKVLDDVSLATRQHEFLVLLGPSGCGKTTLLRIIAGLERPSRGEVSIGGRDVTGLPPRARNVAMVFQSYALYPHMSVAENISFPLRTQHMNRDAIREKVAWASGLFGIDRLLKRKPRELSGGERQRVALARAMVRMPNLFLLDEPLSNLDAKLRASAREELQTFQKRIGITTIYVTHDQVEAMGLGNRIVVMDKGRVRQIGTPLQVYWEPADTFVATFVGSPPMNLVEQGGVLVGFRPEDFLPLEGREEEDVERFQFEVTWVENLGAERLVYGKTAFQSKNGRVVSKLAPNIRVALEAGKTYTFAVPRLGIKLFDRDTGTRLRGVPIGRG
ncbi:MAG TPA: ABC transporter ATP-binding protein [Syntrophobacteria bacterium]|nr:ABC transporter ATP-binding protein [Syntrophobacteria bacterium]